MQHPDKSLSPLLTDCPQAPSTEKLGSCLWEGWVEAGFEGRSDLEGGKLGWNGLSEHAVVGTTDILG